MNPMMMRDDEEEGLDDPALQAKLLAELEELAHNGQAQEMNSRLGKAPAEASLPDEEAPMDAEALEAADSEPIPGAEEDEGGEMSGEKLDPERLRALLASMKMKG